MHASWWRLLGFDVDAKIGILALDSSKLAYFMKGLRRVSTTSYILIADRAPAAFYSPGEGSHGTAFDYENSRGTWTDQTTSDLPALFQMASPFAGPVVKADGSEAVASGATMSDADIIAMDWHVKGITTPLPK